MQTNTHTHTQTQSIPFGQFWRLKLIGQAHASLSFDAAKLLPPDNSTPSGSGAVAGEGMPLVINMQQVGVSTSHQTEINLINLS